MHSALVALLAVALASAATGNLVTDVRALIARNDFAQAEKQIADYRSRAGASVEVAEAISWLGRGALAAKQLDKAGRYASEARRISLDLLRSRGLDAEKHLPLAFGATIEVHAQVLAARGERSEAIQFLQGELATYGNTSIHERIRKNINLLSLEGKPALPLEADQWLEGKGTLLEGLRGRPVLLFLWAHWCGDCKAMAPSIAAVRQAYGERGLAVVGPTRLYGYASGGMDASPAEELKYIDQVRHKFYAPLAGMPVPVGASIFRNYGVSTTPTLVLVDRAGIVRMYHPGAMSQHDLAARIEALFGELKGHAVFRGN
jgi:thiol-disulfide isomerase/thioredoxin